MPEIGEVSTDREIGFKGGHKSIWAACAICGKERWVKLRNGIPQSKRCHSCRGLGRKLTEKSKNLIRLKNSGDKSGNWQGGKSLTVLLPCEVCGKQRRVRLRGGIPTNKRCRHCSNIGLKHSKEHTRKQSLTTRGARSPCWKGGRRVDPAGYIRVRIYSEDQFFPMTDKNSLILEHRLVMAKSLGRCLLKGEHVHHKDGNKSNNVLSNLELISPKNHVLYKQMCTHCELRKEIRLLKWQVKELAQQLQEKMRI